MKFFKQASVTIVVFMLLPLSGAGAAVSVSNQSRSQITSQVVAVSGSATASASVAISSRTEGKQTFNMEFDRNLYFGLRSNSDVVDLQEFLTDQGFYASYITGNFGLMTLRAVKKFQGAHGIRQTGYFGPRTRAVANEILRKLIDELCTDEETCNPGDMPSGTLSITTHSSLRAAVGEPYVAVFTVTGGLGSYAISTDGEEIPGLSFTQTYCPPRAMCAQVVSPDTITLHGTPMLAGLYQFAITAKENTVVQCIRAPCPPIISYGRANFTLRVVGEDTGSSPVIQKVSGPQKLKVNEEGLWTISASDNRSGGELSYSVMWGDEAFVARDQGVSSAMLTPQRFIQTATFTHAYRSPGVYTPTFFVSNRFGKETKTQLSLYAGETIQSIRITTGAKLAGVVGQSFVAAFEATGGQPPYSWSVNQWELPPGLELIYPPMPLSVARECPAPDCGGGRYGSNSIWISGIPKASGVFPFEMSVKDQSGHKATSRFTITIDGEDRVLSITSSSNLTGSPGQQFSATFYVQGGTAPYTWKVVDGVLPPGILPVVPPTKCLPVDGDVARCKYPLGVNTAVWQIVGVPTTAGLYKFRLAVTDANGRVAAESFVITIWEANPSISVTSPDGSAKWALGKSYVIRWQVNDAPSIAPSNPTLIPTVAIALRHPRLACLDANPPCLMKMMEVAPYVLASYAPNTGLYEWTIPTNLATVYQGEVYIEITLNGTDISGKSRTFIIVPLNQPSTAGGY